MKSMYLMIPGVLILGTGFTGVGSHDLTHREAVPGHSDDKVRLFLARHCQECHGGEKPKGDFRVDHLATDFADKANRQKWQVVLKRVQAGEMPPKSKPRPPEGEVRALADWITGKVQAAEAVQQAQGRTVL